MGVWGDCGAEGRGQGDNNHDNHDNHDNNLDNYDNHDNHDNLDNHDNHDDNTHGVKILPQLGFFVTTNPLEQGLGGELFAF